MRGSRDPEKRRREPAASVFSLLSSSSNPLRVKKKRAERTEPRNAYDAANQEHHLRSPFRPRSRELSIFLFQLGLAYSFCLEIMLDLFTKQTM